MNTRLQLMWTQLNLFIWTLILSIGHILIKKAISLFGWNLVFQTKGIILLNPLGLILIKGIYL